MSFHGEMLKDLSAKRAELKNKFEEEDALLRHKRDVIKAYLEGKAIQAQFTKSASGVLGQWNPISHPNWDFAHFNYRVAPELRLKRNGVIVFRTPDGGMDVVHGFTTLEQGEYSTYRGHPIITYFQHD